MDDTTVAELKRIDAENNRQNARIEELEHKMDSMQELVLSVQKLAINMESMIKEQARQGDRLAKLESEPAEAWNSMKHTIITTVIGIVVGAVCTGLFTNAF